jgi:hypothetical protein
VRWSTPTASADAGLFGGITDIGLEEVSGERARSTASSRSARAHAWQMRPEFDVTLAYNPASMLLPVARVEGIGFTALGAEFDEGGRSSAARAAWCAWTAHRSGGSARACCSSSLGSAATTSPAVARGAVDAARPGGPRSARAHAGYDSKFALLTPAGREALARSSPAAASCSASIAPPTSASCCLLQAQQRARRGVRRAEAWKVADALKAAKVPVFVDSARRPAGRLRPARLALENAARLRAPACESRIQSAGLAQRAQDAPDAAGNAVANGLPWEDGAGRADARAGGNLRRRRRLRHASRSGKRADLVLWSGDPLEVSTLAEQVWLRGRAACRCARARPSCATATCILRTVCHVPIRPARSDHAGIGGVASGGPHFAGRSLPETRRWQH